MLNQILNVVVDKTNKKKTIDQIIMVLTELGESSLIASFESELKALGKDWVIACKTYGKIANRKLWAAQARERANIDKHWRK